MGRDMGRCVCIRDTQRRDLSGCKDKVREKEVEEWKDEQTERQETGQKNRAGRCRIYNVGYVPDK